MSFHSLRDRGRKARFRLYLCRALKPTEWRSAHHRSPPHPETAVGSLCPHKSVRLRTAACRSCDTRQTEIHSWNKVRGLSLVRDSGYRKILLRLSTNRSEEH